MKIPNKKVNENRPELAKIPWFLGAKAPLELARLIDSLIDWLWPVMISYIVMTSYD